MPASTRTRVVVLLASIVVALALLLAGAVVARADDSTVVVTPAVEVVSHTVRSGDTLWEIAANHIAPGDDIRVLIDVIKQHNDLESSVIVPGQVLIIPVG